MPESPAPLQWSFSQAFGKRRPPENLQDYDIITSIAFEKRGDYLAVGDRCGRVVLFESDHKENTLNEQHSRKVLEQLDSAPAWHPNFRYKSEFQSHGPESDYLKNLLIEQRIKKVRLCNTQNGLMFILTANDKTIKLWKIKEHKTKKVKEVVPLPFVRSENVLLAERSFMSGQETLSSVNGCHPIEKLTQNMSLSLDINAKIAGIENTLYRKCQKVYAHAHIFNINSISNNSDGETFISADDLRINLWNFEVSDQCFNIIDMKPPTMEDLIEVITSAEFHPAHCNLLAYSSSRGFIRLSDLRQAAICDHSARIFQDGAPNGMKSFCEGLLASISDIKFLNDGQHLISRDYMNMKLWDMRMNSSPISVYKIHEHLRPKLLELYNEDHIFDKFECCSSGDGLHFATGSYSNILRTFSYGSGNEEGIKLDIMEIFDSSKKPLPQAAPKTRRSSLSNLTRGFYQHAHDNDDSSCNLSSKLLHLAWHPTSNVVACAAEDSLVLYYA